MFDDNPFYTVEFVDNETPSQQENNTEIKAEENPANIITPTDISEPTGTEVNTEENSTTQSEAVQTPEKDEKTTEKTSTGVSTYTSVPDIQKEPIDCKLNLLTGVDKFNLWIVFAIVFFALINFKKKRFTKYIEKMTNAFSRYSILFNLGLLGIIFTIFIYPKFFGTGISGRIDFFTMIEFATGIIINSVLFTFITICKAKEKNIIFKNKSYTFSGIDFLKKSLITFSFTSLLFFFFTESQVALTILYIFIFLTTLFYILQLPPEKLTLYKDMIKSGLALQFIIIGGLSGLYIILLYGTILSGYYFPEVKKSFNETTKGE